MPYRSSLGDAAPVVNKLTELQNDVLGLRNLVEERLAELERTVKIDAALRAGVLKPDEAARLLARTDAVCVNQVVTEVARTRLGIASAELKARSSKSSNDHSRPLRKLGVT